MTTALSVAEAQALAIGLAQLIVRTAPQTGQSPADYLAAKRLEAADMGKPTLERICEDGQATSAPSWLLQITKSVPFSSSPEDAAPSVEATESEGIAAQRVQVDEQHSQIAAQSASIDTLVDPNWAQSFAMDCLAEASLPGDGRVAEGETPEQSQVTVGSATGDEDTEVSVPTSLEEMAHRPTPIKESLQPSAPPREAEEVAYMQTTPATLARSLPSTPPAPPFFILFTSTIDSHAGRIYALFREHLNSSRELRNRSSSALSSLGSLTPRSTPLSTKPQYSSFALLQGVEEECNKLEATLRVCLGAYLGSPPISSGKNGPSRLPRCTKAEWLLARCCHPSPMSKRFAGGMFAGMARDRVREVSRLLVETTSEMPA
ncbi:hypothetical protein BDZ90DRAFT_152661 [Jaminaea rosea]|uniref:Uncharacterized protein n=1 Tax=Jaminaea rosea TaxID=1569628 RepID=A0A316UXF6_9BASI|nr:hypothetical protein BDZ90DRAFT_152661 [Jaminaea rosea]PWN28603.1 hypothetical protein BDZ90DRAFT_152661 [Jaminaea rosea]